MDILYNEILPLFEITRKGPVSEVNKLIQTDLNEYALYVDLVDIFNKKSQTHQIMVNDTKLEYTIPLHYHEIVLQGKGYYYQDIVIKIYTLKHPEFMRVNSSDLFTYQKVPRPDGEECEDQESYVFNHLDGSKVEVDLKGNKLVKIVDRGLPRTDRSRGCLYVWWDYEDERNLEREKDVLMEILNYHQHSNVDLPQL